MEREMQSESAADYCNRLKILLLLEHMADHLLTERPNDPVDSLVQYLAAMPSHAEAGGTL